VRRSPVFNLEYEHHSSESIIRNDLSARSLTLWRNFVSEQIACARKSHQSGQAGTNSAHFGDTGQRTAKISLSARTFLATSKMVALEEQTPRQASIAADNILALLDTDSDKGLAMLRSSSPLTAAIVRSYLEEDLPESFRIFNPALVARLERVRAKFQK
jgi:hypothetical protein